MIDGMPARMKHIVGTSGEYIGKWWTLVLVQLIIIKVLLR